MGEEITEATITFKIDENSPAGTPVGEPILVSNVENDVLTFKLSGTIRVDDKFVIDSNGQITVGEGTTLDTEDTTTATTPSVSRSRWRTATSRNSDTAADYSDSICCDHHC